MQFISFGTKFKSNTEKTTRETTTTVIICPNCCFEINLDKYEFKNQIECPSCKRAVLYGVIHVVKSSRLDLS